MGQDQITWIGHWDTKVHIKGTMHMMKKKKAKKEDILWSYYSFKSLDINLQVDKLKNEMGQSSETDLYKYGNSVYDKGSI